MHVFIKMGLEPLREQKKLRLLEVGMGTGLNVFLTYLHQKKWALDLHFTTLEAFPLSVEEALKLNYPELLLVPEEAAVFEQLHALPWNRAHALSDQFVVEKLQFDLLTTAPTGSYDLIYFDAFGPRVQPDLWTDAIFEKMDAVLNPGGVLVTYCAKGSVKRSMKAVGWQVEGVPGPPGKREMTRAIKL